MIALFKKVEKMNLFNFSINFRKVSENVTNLNIFI